MLRHNIHSKKFVVDTPFSNLLPIFLVVLLVPHCPALCRAAASTRCICQGCAALSVSCLRKSSGCRTSALWHFVEPSWTTGILYGSVWPGVASSLWWNSIQGSHDSALASTISKWQRGFHESIQSHTSLTFCWKMLKGMSFIKFHDTQGSVWKHSIVLKRISASGSTLITEWLPSRSCL